MANEKNLKPANSLTERELREMSSNGGKKSVEARRRKKTMREVLEFLMYNAELDEPMKERCRAQGISEEDMNHQTVVTRSLIAKAEAGDVQAYNAICAMIGEKPAEKMEMSGSVECKVTVKLVHVEKDPASDEADIQD